MRVFALLLTIGLMAAGSAHASSFVVLKAMTREAGPVHDLPGRAGAEEPHVRRPARHPEDGACRAEPPIAARSRRGGHGPLPARRAQPMTTSCTISPSIIAMADYMPPVSHEEVASIGNDDTPQLRNPHNMPMVIRGGIVGDLFPRPRNRAGSGPTRRRTEHGSPADGIAGGIEQARRRRPATSRPQNNQKTPPTGPRRRHRRARAAHAQARIGHRSRASAATDCAAAVLIWRKAGIDALPRQMQKCRSKGVCRGADHEKISLQQRPPLRSSRLSLAPVAARADQYLGSYTARLSWNDHHASDGYALDNAAQVVRQDRANVHKFGKIDREDDIRPVVRHDIGARQHGDAAQPRRRHVAADARADHGRHAAGQGRRLPPQRVRADRRLLSRLIRRRALTGA